MTIIDAGAQCSRASNLAGATVVGGGCTASGANATITETGILSVNGTTTINGASTLSVAIAIGGAAQRRVTLLRTAPAPKVIIAGDNRTIVRRLPWSEALVPAR